MAYSFLSSHYTSRPSSLLPSDQLRKRNLSGILKRTLDRVNVLGDDARYGHQGCVNAVSWAENGNLLLTGGDDTTVRLWRVDTSNLKQEYPYVCRSVISTGHRANIFNVRMLPYSNRIVTCAGDRQIRVFDAGTALDTLSGLETEFGTRQTCARIIRCHGDRVKKLVTEDSPDVFLSLGEDGTVRQHDLRANHSCREGQTCPALLLQMPHELSTFSMSPRAPYQFVVAGDSPYGYLYDRRYIGRDLTEEWGEVPGIGEGVTSCVRRFGRPPKPAGGDSEQRNEHITGCRVSPTNGHEVILTYSSDKIYIFSTRDEPQSREDMGCTTKAQVPPNKTPPLDSETKATTEQTKTPGESRGAPCPGFMETSGDELEHNDGDDNGGEDDEDESEGENGLDTLLNYILHRDQPEGEGEDFLSDVPVILPRRSYAGARNVDTVKDVNFLGPNDEYVVSGSDDGNWFMWDKLTGKLEGIYEGDGSVVNVVEGHPDLPIVAVSGIDHTVKLFAPVARKSAFSRMYNAESIIEDNARLSRRRVVRYNFSSLLARAALGAGSANAGGGDTNGMPIECPTQ